MAASEWFQINYQPQQLELIQLTNVFLLIIWALFLLNDNDLHTDIICNIAIHAENSTLYSKHDQVSDFL